MQMQTETSNMPVKTTVKHKIKQAIRIQPKQKIKGTRKHKAKPSNMRIQPKRKIKGTCKYKKK